MEKVNITINGRKISAPAGSTVLRAAQQAGIDIPTLCNHPALAPIGVCRICVVEVEGHDRLVTACSQPVEEWMKIHTHSPRVIQARKTIVELLLSNHPDDCLYCEQNLNCELQNLSEELNIRERRIRAKKIKPRLDQSGPAIVRELSKCILCGRCVRVCEEVVTATSLDFIRRGKNTHIGASMDRDFNFSSCIHCGQCLLVCPTGALHEKHNITEIQEYLNKTDIIKVIQYSPLVTAGIAEELGIRYNKDADRMLNAILRRIGFDKVFTTGTGTDICITEITAQLKEKLENKTASPLYISVCPAWVKYCEQFMPSIIPLLSIVKSPQQITGVLIKTIVAAQHEVKPGNIYSVSVTPCLAMKFEARRDGMMRKGISDVDSVLTVRELSRLIRLFGIDSSNIEPEPADEPLAGRSSSAVLAEVSGGLAESIVRALYFQVLKKEADKQLFRKLRSSAVFRETTINIDDFEVKVAVVDGLTGLEKLKSSIASGKSYDLIEVMTCPGGCVHGAGLPYSASRDELKSRAKMIYQTDDSEPVNLPCKSPHLVNLYEKQLRENNEISDRKIFFTHFEKRSVLL